MSDIDTAIKNVEMLISNIMMILACCVAAFLYGDYLLMLGCIMISYGVPKFIVWWRYRRQETI